MFEWYEPGEDSYTFYDALKAENLSNMLVVDVGCSTGYITRLLAEQNCVISTDMNLLALEELSKSEHRHMKNIIKTDLMLGFRQDCIDCVVFNPPYVPDFDCSILGGGEFGRAVIDRFIQEIEVKLFYLLIIEANKPIEVIKNIEAKGYKVDILKIRKVIGETIIILKAVK